MLSTSLPHTSVSPASNSQLGTQFVAFNISTSKSTGSFSNEGFQKQPYLSSHILLEGGLRSREQTERGSEAHTPSGDKLTATDPWLYFFFP